MPSLNRFQFIGNLGADPELSYTPSGTAKATVRIATARVYTNGQGEKVEDVQWHRVILWGRLAEIAAEYASKGRQVFVEGRVQHRSWESDEGRRWVTEFIGTNLQLLGNGSGRPEKAEVPEEADVPDVEESPFE